MGTYRHLFRPEDLLNGKEDAANNYARGYYTIGREMVDCAMEKIRLLVEDCDRLQGFIGFRALGGGTGSGLLTLMLERLYEQYGKTTRIEFSVTPSPKISTSTVEPYNTILTTHATIEYEDVAFAFDNEACYDICAQSLDMPNPTYTNLNRIIGQVVSAVTASLRFPGSLNVELNELQTNLVPYPRIHFPLISYAPLLSAAKSHHETISTAKLTSLCFCQSNQLVKCNPQTGKYISCCMFYRGNVLPSDINNAINSQKMSHSIPFVNWCPTGFKIGINYQPVVYVPGSDLAPANRSVCMLANSSAIRSLWSRLNSKFRLLFQKRVFVHHYLNEGMDEFEFIDAYDNLKALESDYKEIETD